MEESVKTDQKKKLERIFIVFLIGIGIFGSIYFWDKFQHTPEVEWIQFKSDITLEAGSATSIPLDMSESGNVIRQQITVQADKEVSFIRLGEVPTNCYALNTL